MVLDKMLFKKISISGGTLNVRQLAILGLPHNPLHGWKDRLLGTEINENIFNALYSIKVEAMDKKYKEHEIRRLFRNANRKKQKQNTAFYNNKKRDNDYKTKIPEVRNVIVVPYSHPLLNKPEYKDFYTSTAWRQLRYVALKKANGVCQCCGAKKSDGIQLHVDHIKPRSRYPELELNVDNIQVLCEDCNLGKGDWDTTKW